jgi:multiple sugar transport system ATP-binding protein
MRGKMATIKLKNIKKTYDGKKFIIKGVNLEIKDKEFVIFVGPSGCGKSTMLRMIAGLEEITDGELYINNELVNNFSPQERKTAMVFQSYALYPHMTIYDNIAFSLKLKKIDSDTIKKKVEEVSKILDLDEFLKRKPASLSGGQRQRVAIGRAIIREPKVLLFDEPLSNLDAKLRNRMRFEISKLRKTLNSTFVYVTHDQVEAMTLADRIVVFNDGFIQQVGTPMELYNKPSNLFVAGFIGSPQINSFKGTMDGSIFKHDLFSFNLNKTIDNKEVILAIRSEHIEIVENNEDIKGEVTLVETLGNETILWIENNNYDFKVRLNTPNNKIKNGDKLKFKFQKENIHLFNSKTEERI